MKSTPLISVIVPVYNEKDIIGQCIESLLALEYPAGQSEVIVVDNNSHDETAQIIREYPVICLHEAQPGSYAARNTGARIARGEILAFTDADCVVHSDWLQKIEAGFSDAGIDAILGDCEGINGNLWAEFFQKDYEKFVQLASEDSHYLRYLNTRNCAIRAQAFRDVGGFDASLHNGGDAELGTRLHHAGYRILYVPGVRVAHINPTSLTEIMRQRRKQGYYKYQLVKKFNHEYIGQYFPRFQRWYYRWFFHKKPVFLLRLNAQILGTMLSVAYGICSVLLKGLAALHLRKLYGLYSLTLDLAYFYGKIMGIREDMGPS